MKGKPRGTVARLEALEDRERERVAAVEAVKEEQAARALEALEAADMAALYEHLDAQEAGGAWWAEVCRAGDALHGGPLEDSAGEAARAWVRLLEDVPDGQPYPLPPVGAAAYFEREAGQCDAVKEGAAVEVLPEGVGLEAAQTAARWSAAWWRYEAACARAMPGAVAR
ncbi:hypothetical protein [Deinococcus sp.]|uniref:hypothetical protein n=1 Tax=Deinococcus sp. TaxID=47478 RepID=UPI003C7CD68D